MREERSQSIDTWRAPEGQDRFTLVAGAEQFEDQLNIPTHYTTIGELQGKEPSIAVHKCLHYCESLGAGPHQHEVPMVWVSGKAIDQNNNLVDSDVPITDMAAASLSPNLVYFPRAICFHPGAIAKNASQNPPTKLQPPDPDDPDDPGYKTVMTVDTGELGPSSLKTNPPSPDPYQGKKKPDHAAGLGGDDPWGGDIITGHGPAIADLVGRLIRDRDRSKLARVQYGLGDLPLGYRMWVNNQWVRGFDTHSLLKTLDALAPTVLNSGADSEMDQHFDILNLSLGAVACPEVLGSHDPIGDWLFKWLCQDTSRKVVVAAGNHGSCVPSWPAAYASPQGYAGGPVLPECMVENFAAPGDVPQRRWPDRSSAAIPDGFLSNVVEKLPGFAAVRAKLAPLVRPVVAKTKLRFEYIEKPAFPLYSVGSATIPSADGKGVPHEFSARGDWVNAWRPGEFVPVAHHDFPETVWTGTSFAAPQVAAELAMGCTHAEILDRNPTF